MWLKFVKQPAREKGHARREKEIEREIQRPTEGISLNLRMSTDLYMHRVKIYKVKIKRNHWKVSRLNKSGNPHREGNSSWSHYAQSDTSEYIGHWIGSLEGSRVSSWP